MIQYPRTIELGSVVEFEGKGIEITKLTKIEPVTESAFLINAVGNKL